VLTCKRIDFVKAAINVIKTVLGELVEVNDCFYHLAQATHSHIQKMGLENYYRLDEEFSLFCRQLYTLAFLPVTVCDLS